MITATFPPSPALSVCDSLADIDDLDAFLDAKGPLSRFGTPPSLKDVASVRTVEVFDDEDEYDTYDIEYTHAASLFASETCHGAIPTSCETTLIYDLLVRAQLPAELLALSYNILRQYSACKSFDTNYAADLLAVSAFALAVTYTSDSPPKSAWWSYFVCNGLWDAPDLDRMMLAMLATLDWSLHRLSSPVAMERAMGALVPPPLPPPPSAPATPFKEIDNEPLLQPLMELPPLTIAVEDAAPCWMYGQITPADTPPNSALEEGKNQWLPLL